MVEHASHHFRAAIIQFIFSQPNGMERTNGIKKKNNAFIQYHPNHYNAIALYTHSPIAKYSKSNTTNEYMYKLLVSVLINVK